MAGADFSSGEGSKSFMSEADIKQLVEKHGIEHIGKSLEASLQEWKKMPLNLGICGKVNSGKSTFINVFRGLGAKDPGAAEVGCTQTTLEPTPYEYQSTAGNAAFILWDLPGIGSEEFSSQDYVNNVKLDRYDCFLIMSSENFLKDDTFLAKETMSRGGLATFVRTKIDNTIRGEIDQNDDEDSQRITEQKVLNTVRREIDKYLETAFQKKSQPKVFIISNKSPSKYQFPELVQHILGGLSDSKREAMLYRLSNAKLFTKEILELKRQTLEKRIWKIALASAVVGAIPFPGTSAVFDVAIIANELQFYSEQFGIKDAFEGVTRLYKVVMKKEGSQTPLLADKGQALKAVQAVAQTLGLALFSESAVEEAVKFIPVIGLAASSCLSYITTYKILKRCLTVISDYAKEELRSIKI